MQSDEGDGKKVKISHLASFPGAIITIIIVLSVFTFGLRKQNLIDIGLFSYNKVSIRSNSYFYDSKKETIKLNEYSTKSAKFAFGIHNKTQNINPISNMYFRFVAF